MAGASEPCAGLRHRLLSRSAEDRVGGDEMNGAVEVEFARATQLLADLVIHTAAD